jgi:hypothetical protein
LVVIFCTSAWSQGQEPQAGATRQRHLKKRLSVAVQQGQLSVNVQEADMGEVLAQIGEQAGFRVRLAFGAGRRISAQVASVELEEGLRHLLRLAGLNHAILYARDPGGAMVMTEVRVFGEETGKAPAQRLGSAPVGNDQARDAVAQHAAASVAPNPQEGGEDQEQASDSSP